MTDNDLEIEIQETEEMSQSGSQLPLNFLSFGQIENDDVKVYIKQSTYKALEKLAASDTSKELGSILLGTSCQELGRTHVVISDYVEAKYTDASAATLTFTHETWDYVHKEHEKRSPELKIVGWQHTHPSYGIFLSNYDLFIQENFFDLPFQVAYVIDPVQNIRGFFQWKDGKIEKLKGYYIYDDVGKPIKISQVAAKKETPEPGGRISKAVAALLAILCVSCMALAVSCWRLWQEQRRMLQEQEVIAQRMDDHWMLITAQTGAIGRLEGKLDGLTQQPEDSDLAQKVEDLEQQLQAAQAELEQLRQEQQDEVRFVSYIVCAGDSLEGICQKQGIDYRSSLRIILALNGIEDPQKIFAGQQILLPVTG